MKSPHSRQYFSLSLIIIALIVIIIPLFWERFSIMPIPPAAHMPKSPPSPQIALKTVIPGAWDITTTNKVDLGEYDLRLKTLLDEKVMPKISAYAIRITSSDAQQLVPTLQRQGFPAYQNPTKAEPNVIWVGPYLTEQDAEQALAKLQSRAHVDGDVENFSPFK